MSEAEYLCDTIALVHGGRVIDHGSPREITERYAASNLTAAFLTAVKTHEQSGKADPHCSSGG